MYTPASSVEVYDGQRYVDPADHLGSVRAVTDAAGVIVNAYDYDGFGQFENAVEGVPTPLHLAELEFTNPVAGLLWQVIGLGDSIDL